MEAAPNDTVLLTVSGADRPGVTAAITASLDVPGVVVLDIEQIIVRGHLTLGLLLGSEFNNAEHLITAAKAASEVGTSLGMQVEVVVGGADLATHTKNRLLVTVLGLPLRPQGVQAIATAISDLGGNIERITRVASYPVTAIEFEVSGAAQESLRVALAQVATNIGIDVAVQRAGLARRGAHLVVMDVDSTLIQDEVIELIAEHAGVSDQVSAITERAMRGELDFAQSLQSRVALLAGLDASVLDEVRASIRLTPGARTVCRTLTRLGYHLALVSGGFVEVVAPIAAELGIDHVVANHLEVIDGKLTGKVIPPIVDRPGKATALKRFAAEHNIPLSRTVAIGDGANDLDMLSVAGLGVAFNAKPVVRAQAHTALNVPYLDAVLYLLGITREQIEESDEEDGFFTPSPQVH